MIERDKWILYKHTNNYEIIKAIAMDVKNHCSTDLSDVEKHRMQERQAALNLYRTRNPKEKPLDSMNHRINTLAYFMLGYEHEKRFIFSPLGNLFLSKMDNSEKQRRIFITMLFAMQFQHPATRAGTPKCFQLFPFRLIFKLLTDKRLDGKLYNMEYACIIAFVENISQASYEELVKNILEFRKLGTDKIISLMKSDEHTYVNSIYEWQYYISNLLSQVGIFSIQSGNVITKLFHPTKANSKSLPTGRNVTDGYVSLANTEIEFIEKLLMEYPYYETPLKLDDSERLKIDVIKEIYSFYPQELLTEIGEHADDQIALLQLPKLIEHYSNNPNRETAYLFEDVLTDGMNMFYNVEANKVGGAGNTDIECLYLTQKKKFAVDAKSTANKLMSINSGRLREHRDKIGGNYTIIITSRYVPAAKMDIHGTSNVIILASTFAEYLYNHIYHDVRKIDYKDFDDIIMSNLGTDVSRMISNLTLQKFAASC